MTIMHFNKCEQMQTLNYAIKIIIQEIKVNSRIYQVAPYRHRSHHDPYYDHMPVRFNPIPIVAPCLNLK